MSSTWNCPCTALNCSAFSNSSYTRTKKKAVLLLPFLVFLIRIYIPNRNFKVVNIAMSKRENAFYLINLFMVTCFLRSLPRWVCQRCDFHMQPYWPLNLCLLHGSSLAMSSAHGFSSSSGACIFAKRSQRCFCSRSILKVLPRLVDKSVRSCVNACFRAPWPHRRGVQGPPWRQPGQHHDVEVIYASFHPRL